MQGYVHFLRNSVETLVKVLDTVRSAHQVHMNGGRFGG